MRPLLASRIILLTTLIWSVSSSAIHDSGNCSSDPGDLIINGKSADDLMSTFVTSCHSSSYSSEASSKSDQNDFTHREIQQRLFVKSVADELAGDVSRGGGEHLTSMAFLEGCPVETHDEFARLAQKNFNQIFPDPDADTEVILYNIEEMISADPLLASKCSLDS